MRKRACAARGQRRRYRGGCDGTICSVTRTYRTPGLVAVGSESVPEAGPNAYRALGSRLVGAVERGQTAGRGLDAAGEALAEEVETLAQRRAVARVAMAEPPPDRRGQLAADVADA